MGLMLVWVYFLAGFPLRECQHMHTDKVRVILILTQTGQYRQQNAQSDPEMFPQSCRYEDGILV